MNAESMNKANVTAKIDGMHLWIDDDTAEMFS